MAESGIGIFIPRERMFKDKLFPWNQTRNVYLKPEGRYLDNKLFALAPDKELNFTDYVKNFEEKFDDIDMAIINKYHPHRDEILHSQIESSKYSDYGVFSERKAKLGWKPPMTTALDDINYEQDGKFCLCLI